MKGPNRPQYFRLFRVGIAAALLTASGSVQAGVTAYGLFKGRGYNQTGPGTIVLDSGGEAYRVFSFIATAGPDEITLGQANIPGKLFPIFFSPGDDPTSSIFEQAYSSQAELDGDIPNGPVNYQIIDSDFATLNASLSVNGDAYPTASPISNYAAAQSIDPAQPFTVQWTAPAGLTASDYVVVSVHSADGELTRSPMPWQAGALAGTATSFTVPANTLAGGDLEVNLTFVKVTGRNTSAIPGAVGLTGYFSGLDVPLKVSGGSSGGDTTKPALAGYTPALASQVDPATPLVLNFSEAMQAVQDVVWINLPNFGNVTYTWSNGGQTLTCAMPGGFPAGAAIIWGLNPAGFKDLTGNTLAGEGVGGSFTVKNPVTEPCANGPADRKNFFFVMKDVGFMQTSAADPVEGRSGDDSIGQFGAFFTPGTGGTVSAASVRLPGGTVRTMSAVVGQYFTIGSAASAAALNTAFPAGNYTGTVTIGGQTGNLSLAMAGAPPVPKCANYAAAQAVDPKAAFTLQWNPFTGAAANDRVEIVITDDQGRTVLQAPNECATPPVTLANSATSITLAANLLAEGKTYDVELRFAKIGATASNAAPAYEGTSGYGHVTRFTLKTTGGVPDTVTITGYRVAADGRFEVDVLTGAGKTVFLEAWTNFATWEQVNGAVAGANGQATLKDQRTVVPDTQVYRVRTQ